MRIPDLPSSDDIDGEAGQHDTCGFALAAQPEQSNGATRCFDGLAAQNSQRPAHSLCSPRPRFRSLSLRRPDPPPFHNWCFATLKKELTRRRSWPTRRELETAIFAWIEGWYNRRRLHSTLGYQSPEHYENTTLGQRGTGFAASRLAHTSQTINQKAA
ncbi:MAG: IS3 family transposase [Bacteroidales bacterium]